MAEEEPTTPVPTDSVEPEAAKTSDNTVEMSKETRKLRKKKVFHSDDESTAKTAKGKPTQSGGNKHAFPEVKSEVKVKEEEETVTSPAVMEDVESSPKRVKLSLSEILDSGHLEITDEQLDDIDTDNLVEEVSRLPLLRKSLTNRKRRKAADKKSRSSSKKLAIVKSEIIKKYFEKKTFEPYNPKVVNTLALEQPDPYWKFDAETSKHMVSYVNELNPLHALPLDICDQGAITGMTLSEDGMLLLTFCNVGAVKIWDINENFECIRHIRDRDETQIDEFYCGQILSEGLLVTGGKLKNRHRWSAEDNDNHIMPCPIKIFDVITGKRVAKLDGHTEEILCIKAVKFKGGNYLISTSQDGYIIKWHMDENWTTLLESTPMIDGVTCMAFTVSFVPNTGNKYFLAACDEHLRLYDFEQATLLQTFEDMYSSYCDCGKFINWVDEKADSPAGDSVSDIEKQVDELAVTDAENDPMQVDATAEKYAWFISRGAEMCDVSDGVSSIPNTCTLHKLVYPNKIGGKFELQTVKKFTHQDYHANSWLVKITSNGRYILAPTIYGQIFVFNMATGKVSAVIKEHEDIEVRDVIFHPYLPLIFSCSDDGYVKVYTYDPEGKGNAKN